MIEIAVPDFGTMTLEHLVLDYNGTLAVDGVLLDGVGSRLTRLAEALTVHVVTADTFGRAREGLSGLPVSLTILDPENQSAAKASYVQGLGADRTAAVGNGRNDRLMLARAALGIAVLEAEGASVLSVQAADVLSPGITHALDLLLHPGRLVATLRD